MLTGTESTTRRRETHWRPGADLREQAGLIRRCTRQRDCTGPEPSFDSGPQVADSGMLGHVRGRSQGQHFKSLLLDPMFIIEVNKLTHFGS